MTGAHVFRFQANDTLIFREGFPFNQNDEGAKAAESVFPPYPPTLVGAVRLALAQSLGFPTVEWPEADLGTGVDWQSANTTLGPLQFGPPQIERMNQDRGRETLYPAPLHLASATDPGTGAECLVLLRPGGEIETDLGIVRLPEPPAGLAGVKPQEGKYLTADEFSRLLSGIPPRAVIDPGSLRGQEPRVGIGVDSAKRTANEGQLYTATHVRPADGVVLSLTVSGLPDSLTFAERLQVLGGEHRMAVLSRSEHNESTKRISTTADAQKLSNRYFLAAQSPILLDAIPAPGWRTEGVPGYLVSAAIGRPVWVGGWNSMLRRPIPMRQLLPSGSVLFMECNGEQAQVLSIGDRVCIGGATEWGFGHTLVGIWGDTD